MKFIKVITPLFIGEYIVSDDAQIGQIVLIQIRNIEYYGIIFQIITSSEQKCKEAILTPDILSSKYISFMHEFAKHNITNICQFAEHINNYYTKLYKNKPLLYNLSNIVLTDIQNNTYNDIILSNKHILLWGVTGSGKTEVYFKVIEKYLLQNEQVLILLPEIAIAENIAARFTKNFNQEAVLWTSKKRSKKVFMSILRGDAKIIIGSRCAIYLPFFNLKCIVVDEEHDKSYKQTSYSGRDMAVLKADIENIKCILVTATPSLETYYFTKEEKYDLVKIENKFANVSLPIINTSNQIFSEYTVKRINEEIAKKHQVLIYLNRRGFATSVQCLYCKMIQYCKCKTVLYYHYKIHKFYCHKCFKQYNASECVYCSSCCFRYIGQGVEKIASDAHRIFKFANIRTISSDDYDFKQLENVDIFVGTQMITKGHDFQNISLILVLSFDIQICNFRSNEMTFSSLIQTIGRAGRSNKIQQAEIIIYTNYPYHPIIKYLKSNNMEEFLNHELLYRKTHNLPPYTSIINCKFKYNNKNFDNIYQKVVSIPYNKHITVNENYISALLYILNRTEQDNEYLLSLKCIIDVNCIDY